MPVLARLRTPRFAHLLDFGLVLGGTAFATGAGFLIKVFLGRIGPDQLGIFGACFAFLTVVSVLADLGLRYSMVNLASRAVADDPERAKRLVFGGLLLKLLGGLSIALVGWFVAPTLAVHLLHKPQLIPYLQVTSVGVWVWALWDALEGSLHVRQKFSWGAACRIIFELLRLLSFVGLWAYADGRYLTLDRYMWLYFAAPLVSLVIGAVMLDKLYQPRAASASRLFNSTEIAELLHFSRGIFFFRSASVTLMFLDSIMLTRYGKLSDVGLYEAAKGLAFALLLVSESLQMVLLPKVNQIKTLGEIKSLVKRSGRYFGLLFLSAIVWMVVAAPFLGLFGSAFTNPSVKLTFELMVAVTLFTIPSTIFSTVLLSLDRPITLGCIALTQVGLGIAIYPSTIPLGGPIATAATALSLQVVGAFAYGLALYFEVQQREARDAAAV